MPHTCPCRRTRSWNTYDSTTINQQTQKRNFVSSSSRNSRVRNMFRSVACGMSARPRVYICWMLRQCDLISFCSSLLFSTCVFRCGRCTTAHLNFVVCCHCSAFTYTKTKCILCVSNCRKTSISLGNYLSHFGSHTHTRSVDCIIMSYEDTWGVRCD